MYDDGAIVYNLLEHNEVKTLYAAWKSAAIMLQQLQIYHEGFYFDAWYLDEDFKEKAGEPGSLYIPTRSETLYGKVVCTGVKNLRWMPGEEDYVERTIAAEWDEMKEATANLVGLENTAKKVNYPFHEEDFTGDEDTYAEWEEKLYAYAEKALAVWEEYEALIEEQQAQMLEEELAKLTEWVELAETLSDHAVMLADNSEHHGELDWTPLTASDTTLTSGKYYLSSNIEMSTITITEDVTLCLNGQTLTHLGDTGSVVRVKGNVTFTLCDCSGDDSGCITEGKGEQGFPSAKYKGGGGICLEDYAHFIMLGGTIYKNCAGNGGGVYVGKNATLDMSGGHIINNTAEENNAGLGGGIYANGNSHITITNGDISGNISDRQAGGILMASPSELTLKTENETDIISITKNIANSTGGGLAALYNSSTEVAGNVTVFGNEDGNKNPNNIYFDRSRIIVTDNLAGYFGATTRYLPNDGKADDNSPFITIVEGGNGHKISEADFARFTSDNKTYSVLMVEDRTGKGKVLVLGNKDTGNLSGMDLSIKDGSNGDEIKLSPDFAETTYEYSVTVPNSVKAVGIVATPKNADAVVAMTLQNADKATDTTVQADNIPLAEGENTIKVNVTEGDASKVYIVTITREAPAGNPVTITPYKDGEKWTGADAPSDSDYKLTSDGGNTFLPSLVAPDGTYKIYSGDTDIGVEVTVNGAETSARVDYYTVTFYDGTTELTTPAQQIVLKGAAAFAPADNPTKTDYTFDKWVTTDGGSTEYDFANETVTGTTSIYASWIPDTYKIIYDLAGGTLPAGKTNPTSYTIETAEFTLQNPERTGYTFAGWSGTGLTANTTTVTISKGSTGERKYTANWAANTYSITLNGKGDSGSSLTEYTCGTGATLPTDWTKTGYTFAGWYDNKDCTGTPVTEVSATDTGDKTFWAKWMPNTYEVRFDNHGATELWVSVDGKDYTKVDGFSGGTGSMEYDYAPVLEGGHTYRFKAVDATGNTSAESDQFTVKLDQIKPVIGTLTYENAVHLNLWHWIIGKTSMVVHVTVTDTGSGVKEIRYTMTPEDAAGNPDESKAVEKTATVTDGEAQITFADDFRGTIAINCTDVAGNAADSVRIGAGADGVNGVIVEDRAPDITVQADRNPSDTGQIQPDGVAVSEGYYDSAPALLVTVKDDTDHAITAGIASVTYKVEDSAEKPVTVNGSALQAAVSFTIPAAEIPTGSTWIMVTATDNAGNQTVERILIKIKGPEKQPAAKIDYRKEVLTGLVPEGEYLIDGKLCKADKEGCITIADSWFRTTVSIVRKGNGSETTDSPAQNLPIPARPAAPNAPELSARDSKSITLQTITGAQYRLEDGTENRNWQDSTVFDGLEPKTIYYFKAHYPATDTSFASLESDAAQIATVPEAPAKEKLVIGYQAETITPADDIEAFADQNCTIPVKAGSAEDYMGQTVYIRYPAVGIIPESPVTAVPIPERPAIPAPGAADASGPGAADGAITGLVAGAVYEIRVKDENGSFGEWEEAQMNGTDIENLPAGEYEVRIKAVETGENAGFCSEAAAVTIGEKPKPDDPNPKPPINPPAKITPPAPTSDATPPVGKEPAGAEPDNPEPDGAESGPTERETPAERTEVKAGNGTVIVTVVCEEEKCTAAVEDTEAVIKAVLSPEQQELVNGGETIEIRIDVTDISDQVPARDKEVIESGIEAYREEVPGLVLGMYVDISMFIRIGTGDWNAITATDEPIEVVIGIPDKLLRSGRKYYIVRAHNGEYAFMNDLDDVPDTITISTDMFSSYAIAYVETDESKADDSAKCGLCHICPTFLGICYFIWLAALAVIFIAMFAVLRRRKKEEPDRQ